MPSHSSRQMKAVPEILEYLDDYYVRMIERPSCYAPSPAAMETMIIFIEGLRAYILNEPGEADLYGQFLDSLGYGATGCSHREGSADMLSDEDVMLFKRVADVLRQFLVKHGRKTHPENASEPGNENRSPE